MSLSSRAKSFPSSQKVQRCFGPLAVFVAMWRFNTDCLTKPVVQEHRNALWRSLDACFSRAWLFGYVALQIAQVWVASK